MPMEVRREFWRQVSLGFSVVDAAALVGVSRPTGQRLFAASGGVMPTYVRAAPGGSAAPGYRRLTLDERHQIAALRKAENTLRAIAAELGRPSLATGRAI